MGAAIVVAIVVVTVVVYVTRPQVDLATAGTAVTEPPSVMTTKPPTTTVRPSTTATPPASDTTETTEAPSTTSTTAKAGGGSGNGPGSGNGSGGGGGATAWVTYSPAGGGFRVQFPTKPKPQDVPGGSTSLSGADVVSVTTSSGIYLAMSLDTPTQLSTTSMRVVAQALGGAVSGGTTIENVQTTTVQGQPALTFDLSASGKAGKGVMVSSGTNLILLMAAGTADFNRFSGSLELG